MYARVPQAMAQFVLKIEKLSHIMGPTPILEIARAYGLRPRLWLLPMAYARLTELTLEEIEVRFMFHWLVSAFHSIQNCFSSLMFHLFFNSLVRTRNPRM